MEPKSEVRELIESMAIAVLIVTFITVFVGRFCRVKGQSMEPTLHTGEWLWTDKIGYALGSPRRGDIVVLKYHDTRDKYVKRIIGLPGDSVEVKQGVVRVNGASLKEPYIKEAPLNDYGLTEVPANSYFVLGDNRNHSDDSRASVGFVPIEKVEGRAIVRVWPFWLLRIFFRPRIEESYDYSKPVYGPYDTGADGESKMVPPTISRPPVVHYQDGAKRTRPSTSSVQTTAGLSPSKPRTAQSGPAPAHRVVLGPPWP